MKAVSIRPPAIPPVVTVHPPGSKSHTIRAIFAASAASGTSRLQLPLHSDDTKRARECVTALGARVRTVGGTWEIRGVAGKFEAPSLPLDAGESGLTARFLLGLSPFIPGRLVVEGRGRLPQRPMTALLENLRDRGADVSAGYPWIVDASTATRSGKFVIDAATSSQVVSALLLAAPLGDAVTAVAVENLRSSADYITVTSAVMSVFGGHVDSGPAGELIIQASGYHSADYAVPADASSCVYPAAAAAITGGTVEIVGETGDHPDNMFYEVLERMGCIVERDGDSRRVTGPGRLGGIDIDMSAAPDAAVALAVLCAVADGPSRIAGLESLRLKESDRLAALEAELIKVGAGIVRDDDSLEVRPGPLRGATLTTHNDHRMAMSLALLGLVIEGISIETPGVVAKTWPEYWDFLAETGATVSET